LAPHHCHTQIERKPENFHFHGLMQRAVSLATEKRAEKSNSQTISRDMWQILGLFGGE